MNRYAILLPLAFVLAACNQTRTEAPVTQQAAPQSASLVTPADFRLPDGAGCSGDIARFRAVQENDLQTGHVNRRVYDQIRGELDQAAAACAAGNDSGARAQVSAIKRRHGYPG